MKKPVSLLKTRKLSLNHVSTRESHKSESQAEMDAEPLLQSFWNSVMAKHDSALGGLQKRSSEESTTKSQTIELASPRRVTEDEHKLLAEAGKRLMGRPRKPEAEKARVFSFRVPNSQLEKVEEISKRKGFKSPQAYGQSLVASAIAQDELGKAERRSIGIST